MYQVDLVLVLGTARADIGLTRHMGLCPFFNWGLVVRVLSSCRVTWSCENPGLGIERIMAYNSRRRFSSRPS